MDHCVSATVEVIVNAASAEDASAYPAALEAELSAEVFAQAHREIASWPGYQPTPLARLNGTAADLGLAAVLYKDEAGRFGLGSFKALGGAYAVMRVLQRELARIGITQDISAADLAAGCHRDAVSRMTVVSATDGNHGRSVAWGARLFGCRAVIFIHATVSEGRREAIAAYGAEVIRLPGGYDDSVRYAFAEAAEHGWHVVQDTASAGYRQVPADITAGYAVIAEELLAQVDAPPSHVLVQAGVGGVASAICARFWQAWGHRRPRFIVIEPARAACVAASLAAGARVTLPGETDTVMAGLACGEVSELAWDVLATGAEAAIVINDDWALAGMRHLADPPRGNAAIVGGECSGGAIGALMALADRPDLRARLALDSNSRVLVIGTEGATDPEIYRQIVGRSAQEVAA